MSYELITENLLTIVLSGLILIAVIAAIIKLIKNKKTGKKSCSYDCAGCAMYGSCHDSHKS